MLALQKLLKQRNRAAHQSSLDQFGATIRQHFPGAAAEEIIKLFSDDDFLTAVESLKRKRGSTSYVLAAEHFKGMDDQWQAMIASLAKGGLHDAKLVIELDSDDGLPWTRVVQADREGRISDRTTAPVPKGVQTDKRHTLLAVGCLDDNINKVKRALQEGANPAARVMVYGEKTSSLVLACRGNNDALIRLLLPHVADPNCLIKADAEYGDASMGVHTPLFVAAYYGAALSAQALIDTGADVNYTTSIGTRPLHFANGQAVIDVLLKVGASIEPPTTAAGKEAMGRMFANASTEIDWVRFWLKHGLELEHEFGMGPNSDERHTALSLACQQGYKEVVVTLLKAGADPNGTATRRPLMMLDEDKLDAECVEAFIAAGINLNPKPDKSRNDESLCLLYRILSSRMPPAAIGRAFELLIEKGASVKLADEAQQLTLIGKLCLQWNKGNASLLPRLLTLGAACNEGFRAHDQQFEFAFTALDVLVCQMALLRRLGQHENLPPLRKGVQQLRGAGAKLAVEIERMAEQALVRSFDDDSMTLRSDLAQESAYSLLTCMEKWPQRWAK